MHPKLGTLFGASALVLLPAFGACGGAAADADAEPTTSAAAGEARFAESLEDEPCAVVTKETVAAVFDIPAGEITADSGMFCTYEWEGGGRTVDVTVHINSVAEDAERAASRFASATRGMSGADLDRAVDDIKQRAAESGELKGDGAREAAGAVTASVGSDRGIQFEDVEGVGDEARLALTVGAGDLWVRVGNLIFTVSAYSGPEMPMPDELSPGAIMSASKEWQKETMPQRKEAAVKLAKAAIAAL